MRKLLFVVVVLLIAAAPIRAFQGIKMLKWARAGHRGSPKSTPVSPVVTRVASVSSNTSPQTSPVVTPEMGWLPRGTEIMELRTANARHYSNGDGTIRAVLAAVGGNSTDNIGSLGASFSGYSELMYVYGSLYMSLKHSGSYMFCGYSGGSYPSGYLLERCYPEWDIGSIPDSASVNSVKCSTYVGSVTGRSYITSFRFWDMTYQPSMTGDAVVLYDDAGSGTSFGAYSATWPANAYWLASLDTNGCNNLRSSLRSGVNWWAIGYSGYPEVANYNTWEVQFQGWNLSQPPKLIVDYTPPSLAHDVGVSMLLTPNGTTVDSSGVGSTITPACSVYNFGTNTETYTVRMKLGTSYNQTVSVSGHASGTKRYVTFQPNGTIWPRGTNAVSCSTELTGDLRTSNDKLTGSFTVRVHDMGVTKLIAPATTYDSGTTVTPACSVYNYGSTTENVNVRMKIGALYNSVGSATNVPPGTYAFVAFATWIAFPVGGPYAVSCSTELSGDMQPPNDKRTGSVTVLHALTHDVGCTRLMAPTGTRDSGISVTPACSVYNFGSATESYTVRMKIGAGYNNTVSVSTHAANTAAYVTFPSWTALPVGTLTVSCSTELTGDGLLSNDKQSGSVIVRHLFHDVSCTRLLSPAGTVDSGASVAPACSVYNYGTYSESYTVRMKIGTLYDNTVAVSSHTEATAQYVTFPAWSALERGNNAMSCSTELTTDVQNVNDRVTGAVIVSVHDVGITSISAPTGSNPPGALIPRATAHNYGTTRDACTVTFTILPDPTYQQTLTFAAGLPLGIDTALAFPSWTAVVGIYVGRCSTNMSTDQNHANDTAAAPFTVEAPGLVDVGVTAIFSPTGVIDTSTLVAPQARFENFGDNPATFINFFWIMDSTGTPIYFDSLTVTSLPADSSVTCYFTRLWPPMHPAGSYTTRCFAHIPGDVNPENDTLGGTFIVRAGAPPTPGWYRMSDVPQGPKAKRVKDGGCLTASDGSDGSDGSDIYCLKGNNRCEFYAYNISTNTWTTKESIPAFGSTGKKKMVKKGGTLSEGAGVIYATKGNGTLEFWSYTPGSPAGLWTQRADVPAGARTIKEGTGAAGVTVRDSQYVYLLKGSNTTEFYRYNPATNAWEGMASAPTGTSGKNYKNGSCIAYDGDNTIYALKGSYNEFAAYDITNNTWTTKTLLPMIGNSGKKKKVKDGAGLAAVQSAKCKMQSMPLSARGRFFAEPALERPERFFASLRMTVSEGLRMTGAKGAKSPDDGSRTTDAGGHIWALKGGNTYEYWCYLADSNRWIQKEDILTGGGKKVKGGGAFTSSGDALWALKGNNTFEFYKYVPAIAYRSPLTADRPEIQTNSELGTRNSELSIFPNPFSATTTISYSLPTAGNVSLKLYDVTGKLMATLAEGYHPAGVSSFIVHRSSFSGGVYLLKLETAGCAVTGKVVIE